MDKIVTAPLGPGRGQRPFRALSPLLSHTLKSEKAVIF